MLQTFQLLEKTIFRFTGTFKKILKPRSNTDDIGVELFGTNINVFDLNVEILASTQ